MESAEKDCGVLGSLFQTIINDLRSSTPIWEDFTYKATKLHQCLKTTLVAISSFLEAFQKVADMATNSRGATKEIGSALTRLCMRHRSIETCLKALTSSILDSLVAPLQERLEDWKKVVAQVDKDHAKEYKKARQEIKKAASDTMRIQKKVKKGIPHGKNEMQFKLEEAMMDVNARYQQLEEIEKHSVRAALIEERGRFCLFISCIKPFVDHEVHLLTEVTHLQEIMYSLCLQASEPDCLPSSSEQVITDLKGMDPASLNLQVRPHHSPPSSPSSLGSRKSSMCSINSINSSSSGSSKSHSPSHTMHKRTASQASNSDRDSTGTDTADCDSTPTTPSAHFSTTPTASSIGSTNSLPSSSGPAAKIDRARPHTISAGSERMYARGALKPELFEPLPEKVEPQGDGAEGQGRAGGKVRPQSTSSSGHYARPAATINKMQPVLPPHCPRPKVKAVAPPSLPQGVQQPVYANTVDLQRQAIESQSRQPPSQDEAEGEATTPTTPSSLKSNQPTTTTTTTTTPTPQPSDDSALNALDLEEAIRSLDSVTAALVTESPETEVAVAAVVAEREAEEKKELEEVETRRSTRSSKMQQNSLELAAAIRELEESTAALQSTYDSPSHTSHTSLQCSSGYATMNSTPSGSEDTIASGDFDLSSVSNESEKYFTIPRSGEMKAAFQAAMFPKRPASTAGVPATGTNLSRRSSVNTPKPPPPVRRTASISSTTGPPMRISPPRQLSEDLTSPPGGTNGPGSVQSEGAYAELNVIQQSIQQQKKKPPQPAPLPKPGHLQRQHSADSQQYGQHHVSSPSPDRASISSGSSGGSGHYAVPTITSPGSASVIQSLNAKFASLNQQYQDPQYQPPPPQQQPPPIPDNGQGTYIGGAPGVGDPAAANLMPPPAAVPQSSGQQRGQVQHAQQGRPGGGGPPGHHPQGQPPGYHPQGQPPGHHQQGHYQGHLQGHHPQTHAQGHHPQVHAQGHHSQGHAQGLHPQGHVQGHPPHGHPPQHGHGHHQSHPQGHPPHHSHYQGQQQQQGHGHPQGHPAHHAQHAHPHPHQGHPGNLHAQIHEAVQGEDFPMPPTEAELAEMEVVYAKPPPVNPKPKMQGDLLSELKKRVASEEASDV